MAESTNISIQPAILPISLEYAKLQAGYLDPSETWQDLLITSYIKSATKIAQAFIGKTFVTTTYQANWNYFPICLKIQDVNVSVTEISYLDTDGVTQILDAANYSVFSDKHFAEIYEADGSSGFPSTDDVPNAVTVTYTAGYSFVQGVIDSLTRVDSLVTAETAIDHEANTGDILSISGATENDYNGDFIVTVTDATHFTYLIDTEPTTPATGSPQFINRNLEDDIQLAIAMMVVRMLENRGDCSDDCGKIPCDAKAILEGYKYAGIRVPC